MLKKFLRHTAHLKKFYIAISLLGAGVSLLTQAGPLLTRSIIDALTAGDLSDVDRDHVIWLVIAMTGLQVAAGLVNNLSSHLGDLLSIRLRRTLAQQYYEKLLSLPQAYFDNHMTGEVINKLTRSIEELTRFVQMFTNNLMIMILNSVVAIIIIGRYSLPTALLMAAMYPTVIFLTKKTSGKWQVYQDKINKLSDLAGSRFTEVVGQVKVVRVFQREGDEQAFFADKYSKMTAITTKQSRLWHTHDIGRRTVIDLIFFAVMMITVIQAVNGDYTVGVLVMLMQFIAQLRFPISGLSFFVDSFQRGKSGAKDYFKVMDIDQVEVVGDKQIKIDKPDVKFSAVDFTYDEGQEMVLNKVNFSLKADTKTALIGESGSGKSTIASLLMMLYSASSGKISLGSHEVTADNFTQLRSNISVVFQDPALFSGSIAENIAYGKPDASKDEIAKAAKQANAHSFISKFKDGYETVVGERGLKLSGGQKQRIAIARALLRDAPILILDEATSSLDSKSEALIQQSLEKLMKGRTTLIIAHRLSTIADVDQIITLDSGKVKEIGPPTELAKSGGIYQQLLEMQARGPSKAELKAFDLAG